MKKYRTYILMFLIFTWLASCQAIPETEAGDTPMPVNPATDYPEVIAEVTVYPIETPTSYATMPFEPTRAFDPTLEPIVRLAIKDLSQRTGVDGAKILVLEVEAVDWPDGSLGCGKPGSDYLQMVTPGFQILLEAGGLVYAYHTNTRGLILLCEEQAPVSISTPP